jgi:aryl-alcohol dehydrogenase-like predicted oxidoreductase
MEKRFLGRSGLQVSALSFGLMTFGGTGMFKSVGTTQVEEAARQIDIAIEAGVTLFDTADIYSGGQSEEILAAALGDKREKIIIATKVYGMMGKGDHDRGLSRQHIIAACEASLRRLKTDRIDLYQVHNFDSLVPVEETLRALDDLVRAGKVRYIGSSNHFGWQLTKAMGVSERLGLERYISQQIQYSLMVRDVEVEMLPAGVAQGVGALIWSPLAQGYLSGKFEAAASAGSRLEASGRISIYDTERGHKIVAVLREIAAAHEGATPSQVALNWLLTRPGVTSVIIGARTEAQLRDNLAAAGWSLTAEEAERLDRVSAVPVGYPEVQHGFFHPERNLPVFPRVK